MEPPNGGFVTAGCDISAGQQLAHLGAVSEHESRNPCPAQTTDNGVGVDKPKKVLFQRHGSSVRFIHRTVKRFIDRYPLGPIAIKLSRMDKPMTNRDILARIDQRLQSLGISERAAGLRAGGSAALIRNLRMKPDSFPRIDTVIALANVLEVPPAWIAFGDGASVAAPRASGDVPVLGEVAAGNWLDVGDAVDSPRYEPTGIPADPRFPATDQFDLVVRGTSINRLARDGDHLRCLRIASDPFLLPENELVIVERRRAQGGQVETTAKRLRRRGRVIELWPDSTDDRWQHPIMLDPSEKEPPEDEHVAVIARVLWVYRPTM